MSKPGIAISAWGLLLAATIFSGCVNIPKRAAPAVQQAARHNRNGLHAEGQKSFMVAEYEFAESYRLYSSVENYSGMVTSLVNSSRLYRAAGWLQKAEIATERAVVLAVNTPELAAEVWFEKAKLSLLGGRIDDALFWAEKADNSAPEVEQPRMLNFTATIYFKKGMRARAGELAEKALKLSRQVGDRREEANALRFIGSLELFEKRPRGAIDHFTAALTIDKELALSRKISADLRFLSQSFEALGDTSTAAAYLQRAVDVVLADEDRNQTVLDLEKLVLLQAQSGLKEAAAKSEELRRKMQREKK